MLAKVKRLLCLLGYQSADKFTLKSFCAGRATSLASAGCSLGQILAAGEWRSAAFLRYCQIDELDTPSMLNAVLQSDGDENIWRCLFTDAIIFQVAAHLRGYALYVV